LVVGCGAGDVCYSSGTIVSGSRILLSMLAATVLAVKTVRYKKKYHWII
jgi:hypothetical protein